MEFITSRTPFITITHSQLSPYDATIPWTANTRTMNCRPIKINSKVAVYARSDHQKIAYSATVLGCKRHSFSTILLRLGETEFWGGALWGTLLLEVPHEWVDEEVLEVLANEEEMKYQRELERYRWDLEEYLFRQRRH